jgi:transposase
VNGEGRPVRLRLTAGQRHDMDQAKSLVEGLAPDYVVADKGYDSDPLRATIRRQGGKPVIPSRKGHRRRRHDRTRYKLRNRVERFFNRLKHCRRVATRYDKLDANYEGFLCLAALFVSLA